MSLVLFNNTLLKIGSYNYYICNMKQSFKSKINICIDNTAQVQAIAPVIISASRATDIPAFYTEWFFKRLEWGYCKWRNPFSGADSYISFVNTQFIVFWSKNPRPLLSKLEILKSKGIDCYIQYTLNAYDEYGFEPGLPILSERIETFKELSSILGKERVIWRFDPLILTNEIQIPELINLISTIATELKEYTNKLVFSFADISNYRKVKYNLEQSKINYIEWTEELMVRFAEQVSQSNRKLGWNLELATCAENIDLNKYGIKNNSCIDTELIIRLAYQNKKLMEYLGVNIQCKEPSLFEEEEISTNAIKVSEGCYAEHVRIKKDSGQRKCCRCSPSKDIGRYETCPHGCIYCYANSSVQKAVSNYKCHNPNSEII